MNVTMDLLHIVEQAHSLARILDAAARVIAERLRVDGCFVFLLDEHGDLVRSAAASSNSSGRSRTRRRRSGVHRCSGDRGEARRNRSRRDDVAPRIPHAPPRQHGGRTRAAEFRAT